MRRLLALLALLALCPVPAVAFEESEVMVVARGGAESRTITLPAAVRLDMSKAQAEASYSPLAVLTVQQGTASPALWVTKIDNGGTFSSGDRLPAGRVTIRVWSKNGATFKIPAPGLGRRLIVTTTDPVQGTTFVSRTVTPSATGTAENDIAFTSRTARAFVVQAVKREYQVSAARTRSFCVAPAGVACGLGEVDPRPLTHGGNGLWQIHPTWVGRGAAHAYYRSTEVALYAGDARHDLLVLPLA